MRYIHITSHMYTICLYMYSTGQHALAHIKSIIQYTVYCNYTACLHDDAEIPDLLYRKGILCFHGCSPGLSRQSQLYTYLIILLCFSLSLSLSSTIRAVWYWFDFLDRSCGAGQKHYFFVHPICKQSAVIGTSNKSILLACKTYVLHYFYSTSPKTNRDTQNNHIWNLKQHHVWYLY